MKYREQAPSKKNAKKERRLERQQEQIAQSNDEQETESRMDIELRGINAKIEHLNLQIFEIQPNGHCLFEAIAHQLCTCMHLQVSYKDLRFKCSEYLLSHESDFIPFLTDDSGLILSHGKHFSHSTIIFISFRKVFVIL